MRKKSNGIVSIKDAYNTALKSKKGDTSQGAIYIDTNIKEFAKDTPLKENYKKDISKDTIDIDIDIDIDSNQKSVVDSKNIDLESDTVKNDTVEENLNDTSMPEKNEECSKNVGVFIDKDFKLEEPLTANKKNIQNKSIFVDEDEDFDFSGINLQVARRF